MGNRLTEEDSPSTEPQSYSGLLDKLLPEYMAIGMSYDEYWDGEFGTKRAARKAYAIRIRNEQRLADRQNWFMGQYIQTVLKITPLLVGGLNVKAGAEMPDYPEKPFLQELEERQNEEVQKKAEEDRTRLAMAMMQAAFTKFNKRFEQRREAEKKSGG